MAVVLVGVLVVVAVALARAHREADDGFVQQWAASHGLGLTPENRAMVRWYLHNARVLRTLGVLAGLFLPPLAIWAFGFRNTGASWAWAFVGYLVGAVYAEVSLVRPRAAGTATARLETRDVVDYLPRTLRLAPRVLAALTAVAAVAATLVPYGAERHPVAGAGPTLALVAVGNLLVLEAVERWLVRRPQPFTEPSTLAADDAIRSQSLHSVAAAGVALLSFQLALALLWLARSDVQVLRWALTLPAVLAPLGGFYACMWFGHRPWRVRRTATLHPRPTAAS